MPHLKKTRFAVFDHVEVGNRILLFSFFHRRRHAKVPEIKIEPLEEPDSSNENLVIDEMVDTKVLVSIVAFSLLILASWKGVQLALGFMATYHLFLN